MEGQRGSNVTAAPFVLKTYGMVNDPATDALISWGRCNNSFVVVDPFGFSQHLLPAHFKHCNFSSFVRQLNTYGFRKVDPDRWEFAHEFFLRGQTHLLHNIVRRNNNSGRSHGRRGDQDVELLEAEEEEKIAFELEKLKQEQTATKEELRRMWSRIQETERKPKQMLAFLFKAVQNPHLLPRLMQQSQIKGGDEEGCGMTAINKRGRLMMSCSPHWPSSSSSPTGFGNSSAAAAAADLQDGDEAFMDDTLPLGEQQGLLMGDEQHSFGMPDRAVPSLSSVGPLDYDEPPWLLPEYNEGMQGFELPAHGSYPLSFSTGGGTEVSRF